MEPVSGSTESCNIPKNEFAVAADLFLCGGGEKLTKDGVPDSSVEASAHENFDHEVVDQEEDCDEKFDQCLQIGVPVPREYSSIDNNSEDGCEATSEQSQQEKRINHLDTSTPSQQKEARKQRKELDVLGLKLLCDQCNYQATDTSTLRSHVRSRHQGILFKCNECEFSAKWERSVKRHKLIEHLGNKNRFLCDQCNYATSQHASLKRHIHVMHDGNEGASAREERAAAAASFRCELCNFRARWSRSVRRHKLAVHTSGGERAHACAECSYRASQAATLRRHVRLVHRKGEQKEIPLPVPEPPAQDAVELAMAYSDIRL